MASSPSRGNVRVAPCLRICPVALCTQPEQHGTVTQHASQYNEAYDDYEAWRDLQDVLEERDAEWWAEQDSDEEE